MSFHTAMHTSQRVKIGVALLCATVSSAFVMKGESLRLHSDRMSPLMEQEAAFNPGCLAFPNKRIIMVTPNSEYWSMFLNWFHHAKAYMGKHDQLVVFAQDEKVVKKLQRESFVFVDLDGNLNIPADANQLPAKVAGPFNSHQFNDLVDKRPANILYFLKLNCTVLYSDVDTVWLGDIFQDIAEAGSHDLYITDDNRNDAGFDGIVKHDNWYFCTCFMYMKPTPPVLELIQNWTDAMVGKHPVNQPSFNKVLKSDYETRKSVDFTVLPYGAFPPGIKAGHFWGTPGMHVLHANWMVGTWTKKDFMKKHGVWTQ